MARPVSGPDGPAGEPGAEPLDVLTSDQPTVGSDDDSGRGRHAAPTPPRRRGRLRWAAEVVIVVVIAFAAALAIRTFVVSPASITTDAMADTLVAGDRVLVSAWNANAQRGEVIAFAVPDDWAPADADAQNGSQDDGAVARIREALAFVGLAPPQQDSLLVLRVIAVGGQRIACCTDTGQLELDGVPLVEPYLRPGVPTDQVEFDVVVPEGRLFVLGDDRAVARDSRYHLAIAEGTIPAEGVTGRVLVIAWPFDRVGPVPVETGSAG